MRRRALAVLALVVVVSGTADAARQEPVPDLPISLDRVREKLSKPPRLKLDRPIDAPVATFRTRVEQPVRSLSFEEWLHREFDLSGLAKQSAEWSSKCCGLGLDPLFRSWSEARKRRRTEKIRQDVLRELAELEAARKKADVRDGQ
jgi:hypothetical protein